VQLSLFVTYNQLLAREISIHVNIKFDCYVFYMTWLTLILVKAIFASQGLRFGSPFSPPLADLEYILKFARNATWWFIEVAPLR